MKDGLDQGKKVGWVTLTSGQMMGDEATNSPKERMASTVGMRRSVRISASICVALAACEEGATLVGSWILEREEVAEHGYGSRVYLKEPWARREGWNTR